MKSLNANADRQHFLDNYEDIAFPGRHQWRDGLGRNAVILTRDSDTPGTLEQRNLRNNEADEILRNFDKRGLGAGEVVVKILYAGICGSDLKNIYSRTCAYPYNPGKVVTHEMSGVVVAKGDGVDGLEIGDLVVANPLLTDSRGRPIIPGESWPDRNGPFSSIHTHGFAQEYSIHPAERLHKIDFFKIGPRLATLAEPFACAHAALERQGKMSDSLKQRRKQDFQGRYGPYNFGVVIMGGGGLGMSMAVMAKHLGADNVIVLDNNPSRVAYVESLGPGFHGVCTDWMKRSGDSLDRARLSDMHRDVREICRAEGFNRKGADMLVNCVHDPRAVLNHLDVLEGSHGATIVQAGGSREAVTWTAEANRRFMVSETTITHAYRYYPEDFEAAIACLYAHPELASRVVGSITPSSAKDFSGARGALERAYKESGRPGKDLISFAGERSGDEMYDEGSD